LLRPAEYSVIATLNLNGDYISDALAAQVGGIGIAPGANLSDTMAMFEATHGTAPKYAGKDYVNPGSEILSAEMMLRHMGWTEAADLIISSMKKSIASKKVTYDFARLMDGATQVSCSGFGQVMMTSRPWSLWCSCCRSFSTKTAKLPRRSCSKSTWKVGACAGCFPVTSRLPRLTRCLTPPGKRATHCNVFTSQLNSRLLSPSPRHSFDFQSQPTYPPTRKSP
jgi:hypothetical protein